MAVNRDIDGNVRINGSLTLPTGSVALTTGTLTVGGNKVYVTGGHSRTKLDLTGTGAESIGTESYHVALGGASSTNIGTKIYANSTELIAQIGFGGTGTPTNRLDSYFAGKVGIGVSPSVNLEVMEEIKITSNGTARLTLRGDANDVDDNGELDGEIFFVHDSGQNGFKIKAYNGAAATDLEFAEWVSSANQSRLIIKGGGNVGIGTASPSHKLHVEGDVRFNGSLFNNAATTNFLTTAGVAQGTKVGSLVVSSSYSDTAPTNGIYSKGNITTAGTVTVSGNQITLGGTHSDSKVSLLGDNYFTIGTETYHTLYGYGLSANGNSIGHKFYNGRQELAAQIGMGASGVQANRLDSQFKGSVIVDKDLTVNGIGKVSASMGNIIFDPTASTSGYTLTTSLDNAGVLFATDSTVRGFRWKVYNTEVVTIKSDGKVGIGTSAPAEKLEVSGNILSTGAEIRLKNAGSAALVLEADNDNDAGEVGEPKIKLMQDNGMTFTDIYQAQSGTNTANRLVIAPFNDTTTKIYDIYVHDKKIWNESNFDPSTKLNTTTPYIGLDTTGNTLYPRMVAINNPGTDVNGWIRVSAGSGGILPYSNTLSYIGTDTWRFKEIHGVTLYENGTSLASKYLGATAKAADADKLDGNDSSYFSKKVSASYSSVTGDDGTDGWYTLFSVADNTTAPIICNIRAYAHTSASFIVSKGYDTNGSMITLLQVNTTSSNASYKYLKGLRILTNGTVQVKLNGGATVQVEVALRGNHQDATLAASLVKEVGTPAVAQSIDPLINGSMVASGDIYSGSSKVWHAGNLTPVTTGTGQSVGNSFTVKGRLNVGNTSNTAGDAVIYDASNNPTIHLDGDSSGIDNATSTKIYLAGNGNATFKGTATINTLAVTNTGLVTNLNAQFINGKAEADLAKNISIVDNTGWGVVSGLDAIAYGGELHIDPGVGYTASGRRINITVRTKVTMTAAATSGNRYDVVYIKGPSASTEEGNFGYLEGTVGGTAAGTLADVSLSDAVILATVKRMQNQASIVQGDIDGTVRDTTGIRGRKPFYLDSTTDNVKVRYELHANKYKEGGQYLNAIYGTLAGGNSFVGTQDVNGKVNITQTGTIARSTTPSGYGIKITDGSNSMFLDDNEIVTTSALVITTGSTTGVDFNNSTFIYKSGHIKSPKNATTLTIPAGQTSATWTHNYGATTYAITPTPNSFARHVRWTGKLANSVVIEIDDVYDQDILVDCILIGY